MINLLYSFRLQNISGLHKPFGISNIMGSLPQRKLISTLKLVCYLISHEAAREQPVSTADVSAARERKETSAERTLFVRI